MEHIPLDQVAAVRVDGEWWPVQPGSFRHMHEYFGVSTFEYRDADLGCAVLVPTTAVVGFRLGETDGSSTPSRSGNPVS